MKKIIVLILIVYLCIPMAVKAEVITFGQVLDDLAVAQKQLDDNNKSINNSKSQMYNDNEKITSLKKELDKMSEEKSKLQDEIVEANDDIENKKEESKNVIAYLQMSDGENLYLEYIFGTDTVTDLIYRMAVVEEITDHNSKIIKDLEKLIKDNEDRKIELKKREEQHNQKIADLKVEINKLQSRIYALGDLSPGLEQEVKTKKKLVDDYRKQGCKNRSDRIGIDCATTSANAIFYRPIQNGYVTSFIGYRWGSLHRGIDLGSSTGRNTALYSIGYGVITSVWQDGSGAKCVNVEYKTTDGTYYTAIYGHLSRYGNIYDGMKVTPNTILGYMGDTGYAFGVHLHLELWPCRLYVDSNCRTWSKYTDFVKRKYDSGFKGAESVISFPTRTYQTWYTK